MGTEDEAVRSPRGLAIFLVIVPIVAGALLFLRFENGSVHDLGLFLIGAGVIVGGALLLVGRE